MKKLPLLVLLLSMQWCVACWQGGIVYPFTINDTYIAGFNNYISHYMEGEETATYYNGMAVAMPLTVFIKTTPSNDFSDPDIRSIGKITRAVLQYKILPDGEWVTVHDITSPRWAVYFNKQVTLFGRNTIDLPDLPDNTELVIRLYLTDGIVETGWLGDTGHDNTADVETIPGNTITNVSWAPPYIVRVKKVGRRPYR